MTGRITEIFESFQGEGIYLGERQIFLRFFGCNLKCNFCDTPLNSYSEYRPEELLEKIKTYGIEYHSISFTGGEPLLQKDFLKELMKQTKRAGYKNYLETNGTLPEALKEVIGLTDIIALDFKLPTSTGLSEYWQLHRKFLGISAQKEVFVKTVINQSTQEEDIRESISIIKEINPGCILVLQPDSSAEYEFIRGKIESYKNICERQNLTAYIVPQMHKLAGIK